MENSRADLKKEKYHRTLSNNEDGVGKYIEKILIEEWNVKTEHLVNKTD